jgi:hypothetical protein
MRLETTATMQRLLNPAYLPNLTHKLVQGTVRSDEHRALDNVLSDVSADTKTEKYERAVLEFTMSNELAEVLSGDIEMTPRILQNEKIKNIGMMGIMRYFISSSKGTGGLVGGKNCTVLEYSKLCATTNDESLRNTTAQFVTIVLLRLKSVGGADAKFEEVLKSNNKHAMKNLVVATARVVNDEIKDIRFSFCGMFIAPSINP